MGKKRDQLTAMFASRPGPRDGVDEAAVLEAADAFDESTATGRLNPTQLAVVVGAAFHARAVRWKNAVPMLAELARTHRLAGDAVVAMSRNNSARVRIAAIDSLTGDVPVEVADAVLGKCLTDKTDRVRCRAAEAACELGDRQHLAAIKSAIKTEPDRSVRQSMQLSYDLLRDGYQAGRERNGWVNVRVKMPVGTVDHSVTAREFTVRGPREIAADVRAGLTPSAAGQTP